MDKLLEIHCTLREVAYFFGCCIDTIEAACKREKGVNFSEYKAEKESAGKISLRRKQFEIAMQGKVPMLIWLGKQWLGQSDKTELSSDEERPLVLRYSLDD